METFDFDNFYFMHIDIKNYDTIIKEVRSYVIRILDFRIGIIGININDFKNNCPAISAWFKENDMDLVEISRHVAAPWSNGSLHADNDGINCPRLSLNMDILNCSAPKTEFYETSVPGTRTVTLQGFPYFLWAHDDTCKKITEYDLSKPVLLNITKAHMVTNRTPTYRVALSMRFKSDPVHLISGGS